MFTLGTGVGGGIVVGDTIIEGKHSHGGELGHVRIDMLDRGRLCGCGHRGCLEQYASATAVVKRTREEMASYRFPTRLRGIANQKGEDLSAKDIFDAAAAGDPLGRKIVEDTAYYCALGACVAMATVDPEMIVFGGGMATAGETFMNLIREYAGRYGLRHPASHVKIQAAELGSDAGFIGAAGCGRKLVKAGTKGV
jgi:glucokinase